MNLAVRVPRWPGRGGARGLPNGSPRPA